MASPERRLKDLGITLPKPAKPVASYEGFVRSGNLVFVSGQVPFVEGKIAVSGKLGAEVSLEDGQKAARICAINILAQLNEATGHDLSKVTRVVKLVGFINATPDYADVPKVMNGASDLFAEVFGERGKHARSTVGVAVLPLNCAVEVEAIVEIE